MRLPYVSPGLFSSDCSIGWTALRLGGGVAVRRGDGSVAAGTGDGVASEDDEQADDHRAVEQVVAEAGQAGAGRDDQRAEADQEDAEGPPAVAVRPLGVRRAERPEQDDQRPEDVDGQGERPQAAVAAEGRPAGCPNDLRGRRGIGAPERP